MLPTSALIVTFSVLKFFFCLATVSDTAALLDLWRGPSEANHAAHRQKCRNGEWREDKVPGELSHQKHKNFDFVFVLKWNLTFCFSAGCEEQILEQQADGDQPHSSAEVIHHQEHGSCCAQESMRQTCTLCQMISLALYFSLTTVEKLHYFLIKGF